MNIKESILAVTAGRTDVQIKLKNKAGKENFYTIFDGTLYFHEWLIENLEKIEFRDLTDYPNSETEINRLESDFKVNGKSYHFFKKNETFELNEGKITLAFPKLAQVVKQVKEQTTPVGALVYYTDRRNLADQSRNQRNEPVALGVLIAKWFEQELQLQPSLGDNFVKGTVCKINYLQEEAQYEGQGRDYPILRSIIQKIENPMRQALNECGQVEFILSTLGGLKEINPILKSAASMFFTNTSLLFDSENNEYSLDISLADKSLSAEESYLLRKYCIKLLKQAKFTEAWSLAEQLSTQYQELSGDDNWGEHLKKMAQIFDGSFRPPSRPSLALPEKRLLAPKLGFYPRTTILELRINALLRHNNYAQAMYLTCSLVDSMLLDGISRFLIISGHKKAAKDSTSFNLIDYRLWPLIEEQLLFNEETQQLVLKAKDSQVIKLIEDKINEAKVKELKPIKDSKATEQILPTWNLAIDWSATKNNLGEAWLVFLDKSEHRTFNKALNENKEMPEISSAVLKLKEKLFNDTDKKPTLFTLGSNSIARSHSNASLKNLADFFVKEGLWIKKELKQKTDKTTIFQLNPILLNDFSSAMGMEYYESDLLDLLIKDSVSYLQNHPIQ